MNRRQEREQTFELSTENGCLWLGLGRERREYCFPVNVYNYSVQRCDIYAPIPSICNHSISIYPPIVIENRYQSITTRILAIDWSLIVDFTDWITRVLTMKLQHEWTVVCL